MNVKSNIERVIVIFFVGTIIGLLHNAIYYESLIEIVFIVVFPGIIVVRFIEIPFTFLSRFETESQRARNIQIAVRWVFWYFASYFFPSGLSPPLSREAMLAGYGAFSICLLLYGAYRLARLGAHRVTCFFYGCCGVLLMLPRSLVIFQRGLWFQPQNPGLIVFQWIGLSLLLGAISAGIVVAVSRRQKQQSPDDIREELIEPIVMGVNFFCFLAGVCLGRVLLAFGI